MSRDPGRSEASGGRRGLAVGFVVVAASMAALFTVPSGYFVAATFLSTGCMVVTSYSLGLRWKARPPASAILAGLASAAALYLVFAAGNVGITTLHPFGIEPSSAASIYSLVVSRGNAPYTQVAVLLFDSAGYEAFFRGILQARLRRSLGPWSAPAVAAVDAAIHILTMNPLWVATTFFADLVWGLTYHFSGRLSASFTSHFVWDLSVFVLFPFR